MSTRLWKAAATERIKNPSKYYILQRNDSWLNVTSRFSATKNSFRILNSTFRFSKQIIISKIIPEVCEAIIETLEKK